MGKINSRAKGNTFERKLVHDIRRVFQCAESECFRTPLSGGHQRYRSKADITLSERMEELFPFAVEAKKWRDFHPGKLFKLTKIEEGCFKQAVKNSQRELSPLLVISANRWPAWAAVPYLTMIAIVGECELRLALPYPVAVFTVGKDWWVAMAWENFLSMVSSNEIKTGQHTS